jgi:hypothetical protein
MDHVVPRSMWKGPSTPTDWHNIVTCCKKCNRRKSDRTPEQAGMPLKKKVGDNWITYKRPKAATHAEIVLGLTRGRIPPEWETWVQPILSSKKLERVT